MRGSRARLRASGPSVAGGLPRSRRVASRSNPRQLRGRAASVPGRVPARDGKDALAGTRASSMTSFTRGFEPRPGTSGALSLHTGLQLDQLGPGRSPGSPSWSHLSHHSSLVLASWCQATLTTKSGEGFPVLRISTAGANLAARGDRDGLLRRLNGLRQTIDDRAELHGSAPPRTGSGLIARLHQPFSAET